MKIICTILVVVASCGWQAQGQTVQEKLAAPAASYSINAAGSLSALMTLASAFKLPMGIEWIKIPRGDVPLVRTWQASTPAAMLQDITKAYGYEFEVTNGVVHVYPAQLHGDSANVLNTRIDSFEAKRDTVTWAAYLLAMKLKPIMVPPDPQYRGGFGASIASGKGDRPVSFAMQNVTVREVLDKLCLSADLNIWIVAYPREPVRTRGGFLKTIPLHTSTQRSDDTYIPDWRLVPWGIDLTVAD